MKASKQIQNSKKVLMAFTVTSGLFCSQLVHATLGGHRYSDGVRTETSANIKDALSRISISEAPNQPDQEFTVYNGDKEYIVHMHITTDADRAAKTKSASEAPVPNLLVFDHQTSANATGTHADITVTQAECGCTDSFEMALERSSANTARLVNNIAQSFDLVERNLKKQEEENKRQEEADKKLQAKREEERKEREKEEKKIAKNFEDCRANADGEKFENISERLSCYEDHVVSDKGVRKDMAKRMFNDCFAAQVNGNSDGVEACDSTLNLLSENHSTFSQMSGLLSAYSNVSQRKGMLRDQLMTQLQFMPQNKDSLKNAMAQIQQINSGAGMAMRSMGAQFPIMMQLGVVDTVSNTMTTGHSPYSEAFGNTMSLNNGLSGASAFSSDLALLSIMAQQPNGINGNNGLGTNSLLGNTSLYPSTNPMFQNNFNSSYQRGLPTLSLNTTTTGLPNRVSALGGTTGTTTTNGTINRSLRGLRN